MPQPDFSAGWVCLPGCDAPFFRTEFEQPASARLRLRICGLGWFALYVNGRRVSDDRFVPAWSDYEPRDLSSLIYPIRDTFTHRTYYCEYALDGYAVSGRNAMGVLLGNGWYHQCERAVEGRMEYGWPKLFFEILDEQERTLCSSAQGMRCRPSHLTFNNIYYGERQDARLLPDGGAAAISRVGFSDAGWQPSSPAQPPQSRYFDPQPDGVADRVVRTLAPRLVSVFGDRRLYDNGENVTGWVRLRVQADGEHIEVRHAEQLKEDGSLEFCSAGGPTQIQRTEYDRFPAGAAVEPLMSFQCFRYFEVTGNAVPESVAVVHCDARPRSFFDSANDMLDWLHKTYQATQLYNLHFGGVPLDSPQRERLGYTGDGQVTADSCLLMLDSAPALRKWARDVADCQDLRTGHVQHTAPFAGGGGGPGGWGCAICTVPYFLWKHTGDLDTARAYLPAVRRWIGYMESRMEGGLVVREEAGGWCLGDWLTPDEIALPEPLVNTYFLVKSIDRLEELCRAAGEPCGLGDLRRRCCAALTAAYHDPATGRFFGGRQAADAFMLDIGLGDARTRRAFAAQYDGADSFDSGIFGTDLVIAQLFAQGDADIAFGLLTAQGPASFGRWRRGGATTFREHWTSDLHSGCHIMFGSCVKYLFYGILGIAQPDGGAGFRQLTIRPQPPAGLPWAQGRLDTASGRVAVGYRAQGDTLLFTVDTAPGITGEFRYGEFTAPLGGRREFALPRA